MISTLMIFTSLAMLAFPKQLRGNRIPAPYQIESMDAHKPIQKLEEEEEETKPQLKGMHIYDFSFKLLLSYIFSFSFFH